MKKQFFKKFLALFLTGTMLAGVGCKSYDDDIDSINKKLDELETVTIKDLQSQIDGVPDSNDLVPLGHHVLTEGVVGKGLVHLVEDHIAAVVALPVGHGLPDLIAGKG